MAEIKKSDLVEEAVIKAPLEISANMQVLIKSLDQYVAKAKGIISTSDQETKSLVKLGDASKNIVKLNQDFAKTQDALAKEVIKSNAALQQQNKEQVAASQSTTKYMNETQKLKKELKETESELIKLSRTTGTNTKEFQAAALKAGQLKDEINDAKDAIKNMSASRFENLSMQFGNVFSKLKSLDFEGARVAAQQFAATAKGLTFKEMIGGVTSLIGTLKTMAVTILTNPIFLLASAVTAIGAAFYYMKTQADKAFASSITNAEKTLSNLQREYDLQIKIADIQGKNTLAMQKEKQMLIKQTADAAIKSAGDLMEIDIMGSILSRTLVYKVKEEKVKQLADLTKASQAASDEITIIEATAAEERKKKAEADALEMYEVLRISLVANSKLRLEETNKMYDQLRALTAADAPIVYNEEFKALEAHLAKMVGAIKITDEQIAEGARLNRIEELEGYQEKLDKALMFEQATANGIGDILDGVTTRRIQNMELERAALDNQYKQDLIAAGDNKDAKLLVEQNYQKSLSDIKAQELQEKQRMAAFDKANAFIQASIKEALLILEALLFSTPKNIAAAIAGGLQVAAIAAKPIPKYAKGTDSSKGGLAMINEQGNELLINPDGSARMYDTDGAMLTTLKAGTKVLTADKTSAIINAGLRNISGSSISRSEKEDTLTSELVGLRKDIRNKKTVEINISKQGMEMMMRDGMTRTKFMDNFYA